MTIEITLSIIITTKLVITTIIATSTVMTSKWACQSLKLHRRYVKLESYSLQCTDLQSKFRSANCMFLLEDAIISSKTNPCSGTTKRKRSKYFSSLPKTTKFEISQFKI